MPGGQSRFVFVGKEPLVLWIVVSLLFANTVLMLLPESSEKYLFARVAPEAAPGTWTIQSRYSLPFWHCSLPFSSFFGNEFTIFAENRPGSDLLVQTWTKATDERQT